MKISVYELAFVYTQYYVGPSITPDLKKQIMSAFQMALDFGATADTLMAEMDIRHGRGQMIHINEIQRLVMGKGLSEEFRNILIGKQFHLHPELRITTGPPIRHVDLEKGVIENVSTEDYFLEMVASYTLNDLFNYYISKKAISPPNVERKRTIGSIKHLLGKYSLETVLFMIDAAEYDIIAYDRKPIMVAVGISDYFTEAMAMRDNCLTQAKEAGDKVVPKKRMLSSRGGSRMDA